MTAINVTYQVLKEPTLISVNVQAIFTLYRIAFAPSRNHTGYQSATQPFLVSSRNGGTLRDDTKNGWQKTNRIGFTHNKDFGGAIFVTVQRSAVPNSKVKRRHIGQVFCRTLVQCVRFFVRFIVQLFVRFLLSNERRSHLSLSLATTIKFACCLSFVHSLSFQVRNI